MVFKLSFERENKNFNVYKRGFEWSKNETHASENYAYLLTDQTKSLGTLNISYACFFTPYPEIGS